MVSPADGYRRCLCVFGCFALLMAGPAQAGSQGKTREDTPMKSPSKGKGKGAGAAAAAAAGEDEPVRTLEVSELSRC